MSKIGLLKINIDGSWDIEDLQSFAEAFQETYSYFYFINPAVEIDDSTRSMFQRYFFSGEYRGRHFGQHLYYRIPHADDLKINKIQYASPGIIEFIANLHVLNQIPAVITLWATAGVTVLTLIEKIDKFFSKNDLVRIRKNISSEQFSSEVIHEATNLAHEFGKSLGMDDKQIKHLIDLTANPIAAIKLMVALAYESKKIIKLQEDGKIKLPKVQEIEVKH